jgi:tetratricopeptide (TPR) repeat protein
MGAARLLRLAFAAVAATFLALSFSRAGVFRDEETLWRDTLAKNPDAWLAHNNLGLLLARRGDCEEALEHFTAQVRLYPEAVSHLNLGRLLDTMGRTRDAADQVREAVRLNPDSSEAHALLAEILGRDGDPAAIAHYQQALRALPDNGAMRLNLGLALARAGRDREAIEQYRIAARLLPQDGDVFYNLGNALAREARFAEAVEHYRTAVRLAPGSAPALRNLGAALMDTGRAGEARQFLGEALRLDPADAVTRGRLEALDAMAAARGARHAGPPAPEAGP